MKLLALLTFFSACALGVFSHKFLYKPLSSLRESIESTRNDEDVKHWVLLVAGSDGWRNYRHQSIVSRAYHIVRKHGIPEERIVTFMLDDIATNKKNPYPGQIFNVPNGPDVYKGAVIDYKGMDVNPSMVLAVLKGDEEFVKGKGSQKVIKSGPKDHVFFAFVGHGMEGFLAFPDSLPAGDMFMSGKKLTDTVKTMHANNQFGQMVMYISACHSGSLFMNDLPNNINIYATTSAKYDESSWACYYNATLDAYISSTYCAAWMDDSEKGNNMNKETLHEQFLNVKEVVAHPPPDNEEMYSSVVCEFGDEKIGKETLDNFQGELGFVVPKPNHEKNPDFGEVVAYDDLPIVLLQKKLKSTYDAMKRQEIISKIEQLTREKLAVEEMATNIVKRVTDLTNLHFEEVFQVDKQLKSHECYTEVVESFYEHCSKLNQNKFADKIFRQLINMCELNLSPRIISFGMRYSCTHDMPDF